jgi:hypothetical protein
MEAAMGQSETVKKDIFGVGTRKGQFGTDAITRWDGDDMDIGTPVSEADREAALRRGQGRKKRVDAYDVDYDRGKVKKLKTKNTQRFEDTNKFQLQTDVENAVKVSNSCYGCVCIYSTLSNIIDRQIVLNLDPKTQRNPKSQLRPINHLEQPV